MRLVDPCRLLAASVLPVRRAASSSRSPAAALPTVLGERCRLPAPRAARRLEFLFQMLAATLPVVPFLDQLRLVSFEAFDAHVPRVSLTPVFERITAVVLPPCHAPCIGTIGTCLQRPHKLVADPFARTGLNKDEINAWAKKKLAFGFTFEYNRVKTQLAVMQATFADSQLGNFHDALVRGDLTALLGPTSDTSDGVTIEKFLNATSLKVERSFGFFLGLGTWSAGERSFSVTEETHRNNIDGRMQSSFSGECGYHGRVGSQAWRWRVGFAAKMANFATAIQPRATDFDYSIGLLAEIVERTVSADDVGRCVDHAVLWGAIRPADTAAQIERLVELVVGRKKVKFSCLLRFEPEVISEILDDLAGSDDALFARALGAAMPWSKDFVIQRNQELRSRQYGRLWHWYLSDQSRTPKQLAAVAEQQLRETDPELALQEGRQWAARRPTTIAGIAELNRTRADWKGFLKGVRTLRDAMETKGDLDDIQRAYRDMKRLWGQALHIRAFGAFLLCMAIRHSDTWDAVQRGDADREGKERDTVERAFTVTYEDDMGATRMESISAAVPGLQWCRDDGAPRRHV